MRRRNLISGEILPGLRRLSRPLFVLALLAADGKPATSQDPVRPWLDWRTLATRNYRFHFTRDLEPWARDVAARVESIDSAIVSLVGYAPPRPIDVVIDDPYTIPNGYALPFLDRPVSVWWATPPDPRNDIGDYRAWDEMLAVHELAHIAHLARPSRNRWQRQLWASLPANLGPIARKAPRWLYEGYATTVEGRITGTGRPNNVWRPAMLRQWAIEGNLPTYRQLSSFDDFTRGAFAYLSGSAYLEWLMQRQGDTSMVLVWRRMTARVVRSFDAAFAGVYGDAPAVLYGRHAAELTRDAMAAKAALERAGVVQGDLVQHLTWAAGDPALSPNGERVAIMLSDAERPSRVVVWSSAPEPQDTAAIRRTIEQQKRDPQDVPDRRAYPLPKRAIKTLLARNGSSFSQPRWFADNRRVLVTRWTWDGDGTIHPALYVWDTERGDVVQVPHSTRLMHADPHPNGTEAIAMRCGNGRCDVAGVDLQRGQTRVLLAGDARRSYYRPRFDPDGRRFVVSVNDGGRWRIVVANGDGSNVRDVDPGDGANRYDARWLRGDTLVLVSERGGIPNIELLDIEGARPRTVTRVTGAAMAPEVNARDGSIWFLSLHSRGLDVRRFARGAALADSAMLIESDRYGFAALHPPSPRVIDASPVAEARAYGNGPRHQRWLPGAYYSGDGGGAFLAAFTGDIVGRLNATAVGAFGERATPQGGSLRLVWRYPRPAVELGAFGVIHEPSLGTSPQPAARSIDATLMQSLAAISMARQGDGWYVRARFGGGAGRFEPSLDTPAGGGSFRGSAFGEVAVALMQSQGSVGLRERLQFHISEGDTRGRYHRQIAKLRITTAGRDMPPLELATTIGQLTGDPHPFELFAVGGVQSPLVDTSLMSQRYGMPVFPTGIAVGNRLLAWRVALPANPWTLFYEGASATMETFSFHDWNRAVGFDMRYVLPIVPAAFSPRIEAHGGAAMTLDRPYRHRVRVFLGIRIEP